MQVEAVVFDWAGTLTPWFDIDIPGLWQVAARALDAENADEISAALYAAERQLMKTCREDYSSATLEQIFAAARVPADEAALAALFTAWTPYTLIDPQAHGVISGLRKRGIKVGVLSNTTWSRAWHELIFDRDGVSDLFDATVYSSEIQWVKPHPEAFRAALQALGDVEPHRSVYVGDRLFEDVHGARAVGMRAVHIPHSNIPEHEAGHTHGEPDATVQSLADLLPLVDRWNE